MCLYTYNHFHHFASVSLFPFLLSSLYCHPFIHTYVVQTQALDLPPVVWSKQHKQSLLERHAAANL
jgi:hypothetical protein